jgi:plasmid stabilization system protein ParE
MPKKFELSITPRAAGELDSALRYIAQYSELAAFKLAREFRQKVQSLERSPYQYAPLTERLRGGYEYRQVLFGKYRAIYRIEGDQVYIVRIRHQAQKPLKGFED